MADEILRIDENSNNVSGAVTNNAAKEIRNLRVDATTNALLQAPLLTARTFADSTVSVDTSSETVLAANTSRKSLYITNTSTTARVSLNITDAAVLDQGITLIPGATWQMTQEDFTTAAITGIASAAATVVSVMEIT